MLVRLSRNAMDDFSLRQMESNRKRIVASKKEMRCDDYELFSLKLFSVKEISLRVRIILTQKITIMKNLSVSVYRDHLGDCTNHGITSRHNDLILFWDCTRKEAENYCEEKNIDKDTALFLVKRELWGEDHSYAAPLIYPKNMVGPMSGGNFVYTCDSRLYKLNNLTCASPIPVHDRFDTQEMYEALSI